MNINGKLIAGVAAGCVTAIATVVTAFATGFKTGKLKETKPELFEKENRKELLKEIGPELGITVLSTIATVAMFIDDGRQINNNAKMAKACADKAKDTLEKFKEYKTSTNTVVGKHTAAEIDEIFASREKERLENKKLELPTSSIGDDGRMIFVDTVWEEEFTARFDDVIDAEASIIRMVEDREHHMSYNDFRVALGLKDRFEDIEGDSGRELYGWSPQFGVDFHHTVDEATGKIFINSNAFTHYFEW